MFLRGDWRRRRELKLGVVDSGGTYSKSMYLKMQLDRMTTWAKSKESVERMKDIFPVLDAIRSTAEENGASYVMVIHPDETQVNDQLRQEIISTFQVNEADYDFDLPQKLLRSYCEEKGILCLDLLPLFRAKAKDGDLYLLRDTHYSHAGNELAAASIAKFLNDGELLATIGRKTSDQAAP
jgi:acetyltransferase AlgX (SGNH hydrolase-like protein)